MKWLFFFFPPEDHKNHFTLQMIHLPFCVSILKILYRCVVRIGNLPLCYFLEVNFLLSSFERMGVKKRAGKWGCLSVSWKINNALSSSHSYYIYEQEEPQAKLRKMSLLPTYLLFSLSPLLVSFPNFQNLVPSLSATPQMPKPPAYILAYAAVFL